MLGLSAVLLTRVGRRRKYEEVSCTGQGNDLELIPIVEMETRDPTEGHFGSKFPVTYNHCEVQSYGSRKSKNIKKNFFFNFAFFWVKRPILFQKFSSRHRSTCCVDIS